MLNNVNYNLIETISIISKSLSRYEQYMNDSADCNELQEIWTKIKNNREWELKMLLEQLKKNMSEGKLSADEMEAAA